MAANLVNLESVSARRGVRMVLDGVSLGVQTGDRVGVLGLNGSGKTTLVSVLAGILDPDAGRVSQSRGVRIALVGQSGELPPGATVADVVLAGFSGGDHTWASDAGVRAVLAGLGLPRIGLDTSVDQLSGGERRRVSLGAALVSDADLLILDEPTNHLDLDGIAYLAEHLLERRGAVVAVTHDRWFLDQVAQTTWEVVDGTVHIREGGYSDWVFARAERLRLDRSAEERRRNLARKELAWLRRGPPARSSKPRYRIAAAEALIADVPELRDPVELHSFARRRIGKDVLDLEDVSVALPDGRGLLDDVTWRIGPGDRVGIVGANGSGKSTLLRTALGLRPPDAGRVKIGSTVRVGYLSQESAELPADLRLLEAVSEIAGTVNLGGKDLTAGQLAERFGFTTEQQWTRVAELSGGERRRLQMLRILMAEPNLLVLDEPTNDLDTDTLSALEDLLDSWPGTLLVVSHDRYLLERVTDTIVGLFGDGGITGLPGGVEEYFRRRPLPVDPPPAPVNVPSVGQAAGPSAGQSRELRKELQRLEKRLESLARKESDLHDRLGKVGADYAAAADLDNQLKATHAERETVEEQWMSAAEALESA